LGGGICEKWDQQEEGIEEGEIACQGGMIRKPDGAFTKESSSHKGGSQEVSYVTLKEVFKKLRHENKT